MKHIKEISLMNEPIISVFTTCTGLLFLLPFPLFRSSPPSLSVATSEKAVFHCTPKILDGDPLSRSSTPCEMKCSTNVTSAYDIPAKRTPLL